MSREPAHRIHHKHVRDHLGKMLEHSAAMKARAMELAPIEGARRERLAPQPPPTPGG